MTAQILKCDVNGEQIVCIYDDTQPYNKYKVYLKTYSSDRGWSRRLLEKFADWASVLHYVADILKRTAINNEKRG